MQSRRLFLARLAGGAAALAITERVALAQQATASGQGEMDSSGIRPVRLPPKPNARPLLDADQRDTLEKSLHCQCGTCTLDVYTCRTTDFSCPVSPAMHRDVMALVDGGYSADEIIDAFVSTYGQKARMAPKAEGFNLLGYVAPFAALTAGAVVLVVLLRRWRTRVPGAGRMVPSRTADASDEMVRLEAAIRDDR